MKILSQTFLPFFSQLITSTTIWIIFTTYILSSPTINGFFGIYRHSEGFFDFTPNHPLSESLRYGLIVGVLHGIVTGLIIYWRKSDSIVRGIISNFAVTELLLLIALVFVFVEVYSDQPKGLGVAPSATFFEYMQGYLMWVAWYVILSIFFLIPSVTIAIANKLTLNLFTSLQSR